jgi:hypothetical protein
MHPEEKKDPIDPYGQNKQKLMLDKVKQKTEVVISPAK